MYIIFNNTSSTITFSDIKIPALKEGKAIDLDSILSRAEILRSKDLKNAISSKHVKVISKDSDKKDEEENSTEIPKETLSKEAIQEEVARQVSELLKGMPTDNSQILQAISELGKRLDESKKVDESKKSSNVEEEKKEESSNLSEDKLSEIHARAMKRMTQESSGSLKVDKIKTKVDEGGLDGLAGLL